MVISLKKPILLKQSTKKLSNKQQLELIKLISDLLNHGFTLKNSLIFIKKIKNKEQWAVNKIQSSLTKGEPLYQGFQSVGFSINVVAQIHLAQTHGDMNGVFKNIYKYLSDKENQKVALVKVLSYPILLLCFLFFMLLSLNYYLLPQMESIYGEKLNQNLGTLLVKIFPKFSFGVVIAGLVGWLITWLAVRKKSELVKSKLYMKIPFVKTIYRCYCTSFFCREWGRLFKQGLEVKKIIAIMSDNGSTPLMIELAVVFEKGLEAGIPLYQQLEPFTFFEKNMQVVIEKGEAQGSLGDELMIYGNLCWEDLMNKTEKWLLWVQPVIFLFVAALIICTYAAILLPIYTEMEGIF